MMDYYPVPSDFEIESDNASSDRQQDLEALWDAYKQLIIMEAIRNGQVLTQGK